MPHGPFPSAFHGLHHLEGNLKHSGEFCFPVIGFTVEKLCSTSHHLVGDSCEAEIHPSGPNKGPSDWLNSDPLYILRNPIMQSEVIQLPVNGGSTKPKPVSWRQFRHGNHLILLLT